MPKTMKGKKNKQTSSPTGRSVVPRGQGKPVLLFFFFIPTAMAPDVGSPQICMTKEVTKAHISGQGTEKEKPRETVERESPVRLFMSSQAHPQCAYTWI